MTDMTGLRTTGPQAHADCLLNSLPMLFEWTPRYASDADPRFLPLLYWLTRQIRPQLAISLGVGEGSGYFTLCEAAQSAGQAARIYGIDQWLAGGGTGLPAIPGPLAEHAERHHAGVARLICANPDAAAEYFDIGNIDLLVCDLELSAELLSQIGSVWMPLMSACSAIVLHRTATPSTEAIAGQLATLRASSPHLEIGEGGGIMVLLSGATPPTALGAFCDEGLDRSARDQALGMMRWVGAALAERHGHAGALRKVAALEAAAELDTRALADTRKQEAALKAALEQSMTREAEHVARIASRDAALAVARQAAEAAEQERQALEATIARQRKELTALTARAEAMVRDTEEPAGRSRPAGPAASAPVASAASAQAAPKARRMRFISSLGLRRSATPSLRKQVAALQQSEYFDSAWYAARYPDCGGPARAAEHYLREGALVGNDPGPKFSTTGYYQRNPDVAASEWSALGHYIFFGKSEGRIFDPVPSNAEG